MTKCKKAKDIIKKIKKQEIKPVPKWQLWAVNGAFWFLVGVAVILSSVFFSFILINIFQIPFEVFHQLRLGGFFKAFFFFLPHVWIVLVLATLLLGILAFQKTKHGYRYQKAFIVGAFLIVVLALGFIFRTSQVGRPFKELAEQRIPHHLKGTPFDQVQRGLLVDEGLLGGQVAGMTTNKIFITSFSNEKWEVAYDKKTNMKKAVKLKTGDKVIVIGKRQGKASFEASVVKRIEECLRCKKPMVKGRNIRLDRPHYQ